MGPLHAFVVVDVDVLVENIGDFWHPLPRTGQHQNQRLFRVAPATSLDARVSDIRTTRVRQVDVLDEDLRAEGKIEIGLDCGLEGIHIGPPWVQTTDRGVFVDHTLAVSDRSDDEGSLQKASTVGTGVLTIRSLIVNPSFGCDDPAFDHELRIRWNRQIIGLAFYKLGWLTVEAAKDVPIVNARKADHGCDRVQSRLTNDDGDRHVFAELLIA